MFQSHERILARDDSELGWSFEPMSRLSNLGEVTNSYGLRGVEPRKDATNVVLCLGSSNTFGMGVPALEAYPAILNRWIRAESKGAWEVWNGGAPGYSVVQMLGLYRRLRKAARPNVVIVLPRGWDHATPAVEAPDEEALRILERGPTAPRTRSFFEPRLFDWIVKADGEPVRPLARPSTAELMAEWNRLRQRPHGPRVSLPTYKRALLQFCDEVEADGAMLLFVKSPAPKVVVDTVHDFAYYRSVLESVATSKGIPLVHAMDTFYSNAESDISHFLDERNLTTEGHLLLAREVAWQLIRLGLPSPEARPIPADPTYFQDLLPLVRQGAWVSHKSDVSVEPGALVDSNKTLLVLPVGSTLTLPPLTVPAGTVLRYHPFLAEVPPPPPGSDTRPSDTNSASKVLGYSVAVRAEGHPVQAIYSEEPAQPPWRSSFDLGSRCLDLSDFAGRSIELVWRCVGEGNAILVRSPVLVSVNP